MTYYDPYGASDACRECEKGKQVLQAWMQEPAQQETFRVWKMEKIERMLKRSGVWPRFREKRLTDLEDSKALKQLCETYCTNWKENAAKGWWLYLWGNIGAGKTHTATAVSNELIQNHLVQVLFLNLWEVAQRVKNTFEKETKQQDSTLFEDMKKVELLVIDDIGVEKVSDWLAEQIYLVVNHRYENRLPMIVTSNQSLEDLARTHRPQICSRLQEMCRVVKFTGTDRRKDLRPTF